MQKRAHPLIRSNRRRGQVQQYSGHSCRSSSAAGSTPILRSLSSPQPIENDCIISDRKSSESKPVAHLSSRIAGPHQPPTPFLSVQGPCCRQSQTKLPHFSRPKELRGAREEIQSRSSGRCALSGCRLRRQAMTTGCFRGFTPNTTGHGNDSAGHQQFNDFAPWCLYTVVEIRLLSSSSSTDDGTNILEVMMIACLLPCKRWSGISASMRALFRCDLEFDKRSAAGPRQGRYFRFFG